MFPHQLLVLITTVFFYTTHHALGDQLYDVTKELCCEGNVNAIPSNETGGASCCGSQLLLNRTGVCCDNTIVPYPNMVTEGYKDWACCKSGGHVNPYNTRTQRCCQGNIIDVGANASVDCCGNTTYNFRQEVCCDNAIHAKTGPVGCCGNQLFNPTTHFCCSLRLDETTSTDGFIDGNRRYKLQPLPDDPQTKYQRICCGLELHDPRTEVCCNGVANQITVNTTTGYPYHCCGTNLRHDLTKFVCCPGDIVRAREHKFQYCCGDGLYDMKTEECCEDHLMTRADNMSCCSSELHNYERETCCGGHVTTKVANVSCCSGNGQLYNEEKEICCEDHVLTKAVEVSCCSDDSKVLNPTTNENSICCGNKLFSPSVDYDETSDKIRCCRKL